VKLGGAAPKLELGLADNIDQDGNDAHEDEPKPTETSGDQVGNLARLELLLSGLIPADTDGHPAQGHQGKPYIEGQAGRRLLATS
jgi:hypothetical protein